MANIADQICDAVEILVNQAVSTAGYDRTVTAVIRSCINEAKREYRVQTQDSIYTAFAIINEKYNPNDSVYVLIPQGDFSSAGEKKILGYADTPSGTTYGAAFTEEDKYRIVGDNILLNTDVITDQNSGLVSYRRTKFKNKEISVTNKYENISGTTATSGKYPSGTEYNLLDLQNVNDDGTTTDVGCSIDIQSCLTNYKLADYLKIEAKFRTDLTEEQQQGGLYGIQVDIKYVEDEYPTHYLLSSETMTGNPYNYTIDGGVRQYGIVNLGTSSSEDTDTEGNTIFSKVKTKTLDSVQPITGVYFWELDFPNNGTKTTSGIQIYYNSAKEDDPSKPNETKYYYLDDNNTRIYLTTDEISFTSLQAQDKDADLFIYEPKIFFCNRIPDNELNSYYIKSIQPEGNRFKTTDNDDKTLTTKAALFYQNNFVTPTNDIKYYWGINDISITSKVLNKYNPYLGAEWRCINGEPEIKYAGFDSANDLINTFITEFNSSAEHNNSVVHLVNSGVYSTYMDYCNYVIKDITKGAVTDPASTPIDKKKEGVNVWPATLPTYESLDLDAYKDAVHDEYPLKYIEEVNWTEMKAESDDNYCNLIKKKSECPAKQNRLKVAAVYGDNSYTLDEIYLFNESGAEVKIIAEKPKSDTFKFQFDAEVQLGCEILNYTPTGTVTYYWMIKHSNGTKNVLDGTGKSITFNMSTIKGYADVYCTAYDGDNFIGTSEQRIVSNDDTNSVFITIDNNAQMFKYSTTGVKPNIVIPALKLHLVRNTGVEVTDAEIQKIEWWMPNGEIEEGESKPPAATLLTKAEEPDDYSSDKVWKIWRSKKQEEDGNEVISHPMSFSFSIAKNYDSSKREYKNIQVKVWLRNDTEQGEMLAPTETKFEFLKEGEEGTNGSDYSINISPWLHDESNIAPNYPTIYVTSKPTVKDVENLTKELVTHQDIYEVKMGINNVDTYKKEINEAARTHKYGEEIDGEKITDSSVIKLKNWESLNEYYKGKGATVVVPTSVDAKTYRPKDFIIKEDGTPVDDVDVKLRQTYLEKIHSSFLNLTDAIESEEERSEKLSLIYSDMRNFLTSTNDNVTAVGDKEYTSLSYQILKQRTDDDNKSYNDFLETAAAKLKYHWNYEPHTLNQDISGAEADPIRFKVTLYKHSNGYSFDNLYKSVTSDDSTSVALEWSIAKSNPFGSTTNSKNDESNLKIEKIKLTDSSNNGLSYWVYDYIYSKYDIPYDILKKAVDAGDTTYWKSSFLEELKNRQKTLSYANVVKVQATVTDSLTNAKTVLYDYLPVIVVDLSEFELSDEQIDRYKFDVSANSLTIQYSNDGQTPTISNQVVDVDIYDGEEEISESATVFYNWNNPSEVIKGEYYDIIKDSYGKAGGWTKCKYIKYTTFKDEEGAATLNRSRIKLMGEASYDGVCQTNQLKLTVNIGGSGTQEDIYDDDGETVIGHKFADGKNAYCYIPVHLYLNTHGNAALNGWDGNSIDINNEGGYILSPIVGAGKKESDNSFTGMLMGDLQHWKEGQKDVGLFGLSYGIRSFYLDAYTGKTVIGKPGHSQIIIDPNDEDSSITSANYEDGIGLKLGLSGGYIYSGGKDVNGKHSWRIETDGSFGFGHDRIKYDAKADKLVLGKDVILTFGDGDTSALSGLNEKITVAAGDASASAKSEAIQSANENVEKYLKAGGETAISGEYVISPYIGGGYLHLAKDSNNYITLDPAGITDSSAPKLIHVVSSGKTALSLSPSGNLQISGDLSLTAGYIHKDGWIKLWGSETNTTIKFYANKTGWSPNVDTNADDPDKEVPQLRTIINYNGMDFYSKYQGDKDYYYPEGTNIISKYRLGSLGVAYYRYSYTPGDPLRGATLITTVDYACKGWGIGHHNTDGNGNKLVSRVIYYWQPSRYPRNIMDSTGKIVLHYKGDPVTEDTRIDNVDYKGHYFAVQCAFQVRDKADFKTQVIFRGDVVNSAGTVVFTSDRNKKNTIKTLSNNYDILFDNLKPVSFKYNDQKDDKIHIGLIAQEVEDAIEKSNIQDDLSLVNNYTSLEESFKTLNYNDLFGILIKQIQDLKQKVKILEEKI